MSKSRALVAALLAASLAACADQPTEPPTQPGPEPKPAPIPLGLYEITITGATEGGGGSEARLVPTAIPSQALNPSAPGLSFEQVAITSYIEGSRTTGGQRIITATFRVRNSTGGPLSNLTLIPVARTSAPVTIANTPFSTLLRFDGSAVPDSVATYMVPTGAVTVGDDGKIRGAYPDVLQVFTEAEVAAIALPAGTSSIFPYGFVVRNAADPATRAIPVAANANDWTGLFTWSFRYPLQPSANGDPFTIGFQLLAVQDTETRMTESIEERQDSSGVRRARERATALGATTVTVLNGSAAASPFVTDYPGQRQICGFRTAGTAASPIRTNVMPGFYTDLAIYRPGESLGACSAYYTTGTAAVANYGMVYAVKVRAMDRYGNVKTTQVDSVTLTSTDGTAVLPAPSAALVSGARDLNVTYTTYGNSTLLARGRRVRGSNSVFVNGMTRIWDGQSNTLWLTNLNWSNDMHPGAQDSVIIPGDTPPNYPVLVQNTAVPNIIMQDGSTTQPFVNLSSFDFTITGNLVMGNNGTFLGTGRVILAGTTGTFGGGLSNVNMRNLRVTGSYSATSNANVTGGRIVVQGGRLRSQGYRIRVRPS